METLKVAFPAFSLLPIKCLGPNKKHLEKSMCYPAQSAPCAQRSHPHHEGSKMGPPLTSTQKIHESLYLNFWEPVELFNLVWLNFLRRGQQYLIISWFTRGTLSSTPYSCFTEGFPSIFTRHKRLLPLCFPFCSNRAPPHEKSFYTGWPLIPLSQVPPPELALVRPRK